MSEPKWTPGPWHVVASTMGFQHMIYSSLHNGSLGRLVACTEGMGGDDSARELACADLIAAAPDLYAALASVPMFTAPATTAFGRQMQEWYDKALAALAKARGEA